jgi:hypothetical protein
MRGSLFMLLIVQRSAEKYWLGTEFHVPLQNRTLTILGLVTWLPPEGLGENLVGTITSAKTHP